MSDDLDAFFTEIAEAETAVVTQPSDQQDVTGPVVLSASAPAQPALKKARVHTENDDTLKSEEQILQEELDRLKPVVMGNVDNIVISSSSSHGAPATTSSTEPSIYGPIGPSPSLTSTLPAVAVDNSKPNPYQPTETSYSGVGSSSSSSSSTSTFASGLGGGGLASSTTTSVTIKRSEKKFVRTAAGVTYVDKTLQEWPENDFRLFVGDLGKETTDAMLQKEFTVYKSFAKAKVIRDNAGRTKGTFYFNPYFLIEYKSQVSYKLLFVYS